MTIREPVGVVAAIIPWNGPLDAIMWKLGPSLITGCTVVLKPAEDASLCALRVGELVLEAGFPAGTVNVVTGYGSVVGAAMAAHTGIDKVSFTGSTATGQAIIRAAATNMKRLTLEMGGKAPDIIFADADLDRAVPTAALGVFANSGKFAVPARGSSCRHRVRRGHGPPGRIRSVVEGRTEPRSGDGDRPGCLGPATGPG